MVMSPVIDPKALRVVSIDAFLITAPNENAETVYLINFSPTVSIVSIQENAI